MCWHEVNIHRYAEEFSMFSWIIQKCKTSIFFSFGTIWIHIFWYMSEYTMIIEVFIDHCSIATLLEWPKNMIIKCYLDTNYTKVLWFLTPIFHIGLNKMDWHRNLIHLILYQMWLKKIDFFDKLIKERKFIVIDFQYKMEH